MRASSSFRHCRDVALSSVLLFTLISCSNGDPTDSGETGTEKITTWGEEYIEKEIPADPSGQAGFIDGWTLHYDKFLVVHQEIVVADSDGAIGAAFHGATFTDNTKPGRKELVTFSDLQAKAWDRVSYQIKPIAAGVSPKIIGATSADDLKLMIDQGYSLYVEGYASKTEASTTVKKTFRWGFTTATQYKNCEQPASTGSPILGVVVTNGGTDTTELTTHGDHFFYDRLKTSSNPAKLTNLRFQEKADADTVTGNNDGEITLEELRSVSLANLIDNYDPSGLPASNLGEFMTALARTVGHYRGEGECSIAEVP